MWQNQNNKNLPNDPRRISIQTKRRLLRKVRL